MNDGQYTPTQEDSHAELRARQGWSVAAMRDEIDAKDKKIEELNQLLFEGYNHVNTLKENLSEVVNGARSLQRQLNGFQSPVRNALNLLRLVNCGNLDQAKINQAILELEDIDKRRVSHA